MRTLTIITLASCLVFSSVSNAQNPDLKRPFLLKLVGDDGKPVANADVRFGIRPFAAEVVKGEEQRVTRSSIYVQSDDQGNIQLRLPANCYSLDFRVYRDGYAPYMGTWDTEKTGGDIPEKFEAIVDRAWSVGGIVVDEAGTPVQGVEIRPSVYFKQRPGIDRKYGTGLRTGTTENGTWQFHSVPATEESVFVEFKHRDFKPHRIRLARDKYGVQSGQAPVEKIVLPRGLTITGRVTDKTGKPVEGASVRTKFLNDLREAVTDKDGRYRITGCEDRTVRIVAAAKSYAIEMQELRVKAGMKPVNFELSPGGHVRIRVVDAEGKGIRRARIFFQKWRGRIDYFEFRHVDQYTDENGIWEWNEAPIDEFYADICHPHGMQLGEQKLIARKEEYVFAPPPFLVISGLVIDGETKKLVSEYRVVPGVQGHKDGPINWLVDDAKQGTNGRYSIRHIDEDCYAHLIRIEADGFLPQVSRNIESDEGDVTLHFKLQRGKDILAVVQNTDGEPVANANVIVALANTQLSIDNGHVDNGSTYNAVQKKTNAKGTATFSPQANPFQIVVLADEGYAHIKAKPAEPLEPIRLKPWATVVGTYRIGNEPGDGKNIDLYTNELHSYGDDVPNIFMHYNATTKRDGTFHFDRVPEGKAGVRREIIRMVRDGATEVTSTPIIRLEAKSNQVTTVTLGGSGVVVQGKVIAPERLAEVNWRRADVDVALALPPLPIPDGMTNDEMEAWYTEWIESEEGKAWKVRYEVADKKRELAPRYNATLDDQGRFSIADVVPGKYEFIVRYRNGKDVASKSIRMEVKDEDMSVGEVKLD